MPLKRKTIRFYILMFFVLSRPGCGLPLFFFINESFSFLHSCFNKNEQVMIKKIRREYNTSLWSVITANFLLSCSRSVGLGRDY